MSAGGERRGRFGILGVGAAACLACCAPLILVAFGGLTAAGLASTLVLGAGGLVVAGVAAAGFVVVRRRSQARACRTSPAEPVLVDAPTRRVST